MSHGTGLSGHVNQSDGMSKSPAIKLNELNIDASEKSIVGTTTPFAIDASTSEHDEDYASQSGIETNRREIWAYYVTTSKELSSYACGASS